ncbi:MAG: hypothetical protein ABSA94_01885 [Acidobacteriaceae bacterium]|jgi:hypothetical protein
MPPGAKDGSRGRQAGQNPTGPPAVGPPPAASTAALVKVKVGVNFKFILGFMPANQMAFTGTSENVVHE